MSAKQQKKKPAKKSAKVIKLPTAKPKKKRSAKPRWFKLESFFDGDAQVVMKVGDEDIVLCGWIPPYNDVAVVLVPTSITQQQGMALQKILEANLRAPVLLMTNNTQLCRLRLLSDTEADRIMKEGSDGIVHISKEDPKEEDEETIERREEDPEEADKVPAISEESEEGGVVRGEAGDRDEGGLRLADAGDADGTREDDEGPEDVLPAAEGEQREPGGAGEGS